MFQDISRYELEETNGGVVVSGTVLLICAGSSFVLGGIFGAGVYVGYKNAGK